MSAQPNGTWSDPLFADISEWPFPVSAEDQISQFMFRGDPLPAPRERITFRGTYRPDNYQAYRDSLRFRMRRAFSDGQNIVDKETGQFGIKAAFFRRTRQRTDVDNLLKSVCDAGTGLYWKDDSQIVEQFGRTFFESDDPRIVILVYAVRLLPFEEERHTRPCPRCGGPVIRRSLADFARRAQYCSRDCSRAPVAALKCAYCARPFTVPLCIQSKRPQQFCSRECAIEGVRERRRTKKLATAPRCSDCGEPLANRKATRCRPCFYKFKSNSKSTPYQWIRLGALDSPTQPMPDFNEPDEPEAEIEY